MSCCWNSYPAIRCHEHFRLGEDIVPLSKIKLIAASEPVAGGDSRKELFLLQILAKP